MRVITFNANGIRSAAQKGFFQWLAQQKADVVCIQETKAQTAQLADATFWPQDYQCFYFDAEKKGYSGVAIYSRKPPDQVIRGLGWEDMDAEGRYIEARFGELCVASVYVPSGSSGDERQTVKFGFMDRFADFLNQRLDDGRRHIICGDWNIAHKAIDLKNWRGNQKNSGFLPEERAWMDRRVEDGWVDAFRTANQQPEQYTWWSNRGQAWAKNVGWRIDYQIISPCLQPAVAAADIYKTERFSDHAPLTIDYSHPF